MLQKENKITIISDLKFHNSYNITMTVENLSKEQLLEKFELFLFNMDDIVEAFVEKLESKGITLDYSLRSLTLLESYLSENKVTIQDDDYNDASEYVGGSC